MGQMEMSLVFSALKSLEDLCLGVTAAKKLFRLEHTLPTLQTRPFVKDAKKKKKEMKKNN